MTEINSKDDRRRQMLKTMGELESKVKTQDEFTPDIIAKELGASKVWMYKLVGSEFRVARSRLKGPKSSPKTTESKLRERIENLTNQLKGAKQNHLDEINEYYKSAIKQIEDLDEGNRSLRSQVDLYKRRLREAVDEIAALLSKIVLLEQQLADKKEDTKVNETQVKRENEPNTILNNSTLVDSSKEYSN